MFVVEKGEKLKFFIFGVTAVYSPAQNMFSKLSSSTFIITSKTTAARVASSGAGSECCLFLLTVLV